MAKSQTKKQPKTSAVKDKATKEPSKTQEVDNKKTAPVPEEVTTTEQPEVKEQVVTEQPEVKEQVVTNEQPEVKEQVVTNEQPEVKEQVVTNDQQTTVQKTDKQPVDAPANVTDSQLKQESDEFSKDREAYQQLDDAYKQMSEQEFLSVMENSRQAEGIRQKLKGIKAGSFDFRQRYSYIAWTSLSIFAIIMIIANVIVMAIDNRIVQYVMLGVAGADIIGVLVMLAIVYHKEHINYPCYYYSTQDDFISVTEAKEYTVVYVDGKGYLVNDKGVRVFTREEYMVWADAYGCGLATFLNAPNGYLTYEQTKKNERLSYLGEYDNESYIITQGDCLVSINSVGVTPTDKIDKRTNLPKLRYDVTIKLPLELIVDENMPEYKEYKIPLNRETALKLKDAGCDLTENTRFALYDKQQK